MNKLLMASNGEQLTLRSFRATVVLLITCGLGAIFWAASTPLSQAQDLTPEKMIESQLPEGKTLQTADKPEFLAAVCAAVRKWRPSAPQIVRAAIRLRPEWKKDILRTAFQCLEIDDCRFLNRVLWYVIDDDPDHADEYLGWAIEWAPACAGAFGRDGRGEGEFGAPPGNILPPPGSIGGGGGQGNVVAVCHNGMTIFVSPQGAEGHLRNHPGDTLGPCVVTPVTNR